MGIRSRMFRRSASRRSTKKSHQSAFIAHNRVIYFLNRPPPGTDARLARPEAVQLNPGIGPQPQPREARGRPNQPPTLPLINLPQAVALVKPSNPGEWNRNGMEPQGKNPNWNAPEPDRAGPTGMEPHQASGFPSLPRGIHSPIPEQRIWPRRGVGSGANVGWERNQHDPDYLQSVRGRHRTGGTTRIVR